MVVTWGIPHTLQIARQSQMAIKGNIRGGFTSPGAPLGSLLNQKQGSPENSQYVDILSTLSSIWSGNLTHFVLKDKTNECRKDNYVKWPSVIYQRSRHYQVYVQRDKAC